MDIDFCVHYQGDGNPPTNRFCRRCPFSYIACDELWNMVVQLCNSNGGDPVSLLNTNADLFPNVNNPDIVHLQVNRRWNLGKEDFLHFIGTGHVKTSVSGLDM